MPAWPASRYRTTPGEFAQPLTRHDATAAPQVEFPVRTSGVASTGLSTSFPYWSLRDRRWWTIFQRGVAVASVISSAGSPLAAPTKCTAATPRDAAHHMTTRPIHAGAKVADGKGLAEGGRRSRQSGPTAEARIRHQAQRIAHHRRGACRSKKSPCPRQSSEYCLARIKSALGQHGQCPSVN